MTMPLDQAHQRRATIGKFVLAALLAVVLAVALLQVTGGPAGRRITAYFATAIGVYPHSDVRVLGVKVGQIESITPQGRQVKVAMKVDRKIAIPADAKAVVVAPNLVSDRYVQLTPAYTGGPAMPDRYEIPATSTATPLELDELYTSLRDFTSKLGPNGINANGALSDVIKTGAKNLDGNGQKFNQVIGDLGKAAATLNHSAGDLYATMDNLNKFTTMLRANDSEVRNFQRQLAEVSTNLSGDRYELAGALDQLGPALAVLTDFFKEIRPLLRKDIDKLARLTRTLVDQRRSLAEALDVAPLASQNAMKAYDPESRTLMTRGNLLEITAAFGEGTQGMASVPVCAAAGTRANLRKMCEPVTRGLRPPTGQLPADAPPLPLPPSGLVQTGAAQ